MTGAVVVLMISLVVLHVGWAIKYRALRNRYRALLFDSQSQLVAQSEFKRQFEQYRKRFDPLVIREIDNVVTIERGEK